MTNKEAIKAISDNMPTSGYYILKEPLAMAINALEKEHEYRWHDLRKNPSDLPKNFKVVLICIKGYEGRMIGIDLAMHNKITKIWGTVNWEYKDEDVIAWREIEPFEELNDGNI